MKKLIHYDHQQTRTYGLHFTLAILIISIGVSSAAGKVKNKAREMNPTIFIETNTQSQRSLSMPWRNCIAIGRAYELLRHDVLEHLKFIQQELGFRYCRFHGIFHDDMAVAVERPDGSLAYRWQQVDKVYDALLSMGLRPFVELSPMPKALASGTQTIFKWEMNVTPPKSYGFWAEVVENFVLHCIDRYGLEEVRQWYFEVWNEPDLAGFWTGSQQDYWKLYDTTAFTLKKIDAQLKVGGPATSRAAWIEDMINHCVENQVPIDFISTHSYPQDEYVLYQDRTGSPHQLGEYFADTVRKVKQQVQRSSLPQLEIHWTEWNTMSARSTAEVSWTNNPTVDNLFAASFIVKNCMALDDACHSLTYWVATDVFEEAGMPHSPFSGTYGLLNIHGIPKASFHAFSLLKRMKGRLLDIAFKKSPPEGCGLCVTEELDVIRLLLWNHHKLEVQNQPTWEQAIQLPVRNQKKRIIITTRIKAGAGSAYETWCRMGGLHDLSPTEEKLLQAHAQPEYDFELPEIMNSTINYFFKLLPGEVLYMELRPVGQKAVLKGADSPDSKKWDIQMGQLSK